MHQILPTEPIFCANGWFRWSTTNSPFGIPSFLHSDGTGAQFGCCAIKIACVRYDTVAILAVSMNIKDRVHAVVWHFDGLPMTVARCVPIGDVCLFGANEIVYLNQSVPPRGISLNSCANEFSRFPLNDQQQLRLCLAALNIGSLINSIVRVRGHGAECLVDSKFQQGIQTCFFATLDGSFGYVRPLTEKVFRRLHMLQQVMNLHVPLPGGLNPRGSRAARPQRTGTNQQISLAKNIVDGLLVMQYLYLSVQDKTDLARKLGTSRYQIIDDLIELCRTVSHY